MIEKLMITLAGIACFFYICNYVTQSNANETYLDQPVPSNCAQPLQATTFAKIDSIPIDILTPISLYYYEYPNDYFSTALQSLIDLQTIDITAFKTLPVELKDNTLQNTTIAKLVTRIEQHLIKKINNLSALQHTGEDYKIIRRWINRIQHSNPIYAFDLDILVYRSGKSNGKHINTTVIYNQGAIIIKTMSVVGMVTSDKIYLSQNSTAYQDKLLLPYHNGCLSFEKSLSETIVPTKNH